MFGRRVAVVACEFDFLAGSIGVAAAERITSAVERATAQRLPLLASPSSGGTRMQEGTVAFLQMVKIAAAVTLHKRAHLPYLVYLRHPTTGGVFASWGSLGHITVAQPGALIGFLGPRVYEQLYGEPFPAGVQTAENLLRHGVIDGVVGLEALRPTLDRALTVIADPPGVGAGGPGGRGDPRGAGLGLGGGLPPAGPARGELAAARRRHRPGAAVGDARRGGHHGAGAGPLRRSARGRGRTAARHRWAVNSRVAPLLPPSGPGRPAGGPPRHGTGREPATAAGAGDRHGRPGTVGRRRTERSGGRDRALPVRPGDPGHPDGLGAARPGQRRARAGDGSRRPGAGRPARLAGAAAAGGCQRDRVPRHRARPGTGWRPRHSVGRSAAQRDRRRHRARTSRCRRRTGGVRPAALRGDRPGAGRPAATTAGRPRYAARLERYRRIGLPG